MMHVPNNGATSFAAAVRRLFHDVQQRNLFVWGEAGSGKTHLIARVLRQVRDTMGGVVSCYVLMPESVCDRFWTYLRGRLVGDLLTPLGEGRTGLDRLLRAWFPDLAAATGKGGSILHDVMRLFGQQKPGEKLDRLLRSKVELDARVARAIAHLYGEDEVTTQTPHGASPASANTRGWSGGKIGAATVVNAKSHRQLT